MASVVNSNKIILRDALNRKIENIGTVGRLQFASIAGCRTRSVDIYRV